MGVTLRLTCAGVAWTQRNSLNWRKRRGWRSSRNQAKPSSCPLDGITRFDVTSYLDVFVDSGGQNNIKSGHDGSLAVVAPSTVK